MELENIEDLNLIEELNIVTTKKVHALNYKNKKNKAPSSVEHDNRKLYNKDLQVIGDRILSFEEEQEFFKRIKSGDNKAKKEFASLNLRLVISIAKKYNSGVNTFSELDIIQEGNVGLMKAISKFDPTKGYKFSTYATTWIHQSIKRSFEEKVSIIRIPNLKYQKINRIKKFISTFIAEKGYQPSNLDIKNELKISEKEIDILKKYLKVNIVSLNEKFASDKYAGDKDTIKTKADYVSDNFNLEDFVVEKDDVNTIQKAISKLTKEEKEVVLLKFFKNYKMLEIEHELNISRTKINKILKNAMETLKVELKNI